MASRSPEARVTFVHIVVVELDIIIMVTKAGSAIH